MPDTNTGTSRIGLVVLGVTALVVGAFFSAQGTSNSGPQPTKPTPTVSTTDDNRDKLELIVESSDPNAGLSVKKTGDIHTADHYPQKVGTGGKPGHHILRDTIMFNPKTPGTFEVRVRVLSRPNLPDMWRTDFVSCVIQHPDNHAIIDHDHAETKRTSINAAVAKCGFRTPLPK